MVGDRRQTLFAAHFVDDLQHALTIRAVLDAEFLDEATIVDQVVARQLLAAGLLVESDIGVG